MRTRAARVYLCTCVPVYLISHRASGRFPLLRQAQHKVSIPRPRGDVSRTGMESPMLSRSIRSPCGLALSVFTCVRVYLST